LPNVCFARPRRDISTLALRTSVRRESSMR
jgi:hypothetical protein